MTAAASRVQLQTALTSAVPLAAVYPMPPMSVAAPAVIVAPEGWDSINPTTVRYRVSVTVVTNKPDTTQAMEDLEAMTAAAWLATWTAGWAPGDASGPLEVTIAEQPYIAMTFPASRQTNL